MLRYYHFEQNQNKTKDTGLVELCDFVVASSIFTNLKTNNIFRVTSNEFENYKSQPVSLILFLFVASSNKTRSSFCFNSIRKLFTPLNSP